MATVRTPPPLPRRWYPVYAIALFGTLVAIAALIVPTRAEAVPSARPTSLVGVLQLTPGSCSGGKVTGTYLRMILPSGGANGPYLSNNDSTCSDQSFTPLAPGSDGGLRIGSYQQPPSPAFSANGDARASRITKPAKFYGTGFATGTSKTDPQTKSAVPAPRLTVTGSTLSADLRSFAVTWNNQDFNQGAPKPNGSTPGTTRLPTGTYDAATGAFTLSWTSQVVGGPFDKFTGSWHLEGRFVPAAGTRAPGAAAAGTGTGSSTGAGNGTAVPGAVVPGAPAAAGAAPGAPAGAAVPAAAAAGTTTATAVPATVKTVTTQKWHVSTPVVGLAAGIALLGLGALVLLTVTGRRADKP